MITCKLYLINVDKNVYEWVFFNISYMDCSVLFFVYLSNATGATIGL